MGYPCILHTQNHPAGFGGSFTDGFSRLEERRKVKGAAYHERKKAARRQLSEAQRNVGANSKAKAELANLGY